MLIDYNVISTVIFFLEILPIAAIRPPAAGPTILHNCNGKKFKHSNVVATAKVALKAINDYKSGAKKININTDLRIEKSFFDPQTKKYRTSFNWPLRSSTRKFAPGTKGRYRIILSDSGYLNDVAYYDSNKELRSCDVIRSF
ncbi:BgTH12-01913 [Blumeria graminis f. sp. triticale]|uniref:BgTH12-01910 n=1 Tax=Blumeria graminis f. sp. triticale TaxID=1689686 RepID=A0A9W4D5G1_BLUGR|nr:BgTH12-01910 [Blumeria graminis f. sp. triticale]CAD6501663.1 BgTH12-01913 [Blumeria graminis f. sp. triticale]